MIQYTHIHISWTILTPDPTRSFLHRLLHSSPGKSFLPCLIGKICYLNAHLVIKVYIPEPFGFSCISSIFFSSCVILSQNCLLQFCTSFRICLSKSGSVKLKYMYSAYQGTNWVFLCSPGALESGVEPVHGVPLCRLFFSSSIYMMPGLEEYL